MSECRRPRGPAALIVGLFLGFPFFETASLAWSSGSMLEIFLLGALVALAAWLLLLRPMDHLDAGTGDPLDRLLACPYLRLFLRACLIVIVVVLLRAVLEYWQIAINLWIESHRGGATFLRGPWTARLVSGFFGAWALWRAFQTPVRVQASVHALSGVSVMILLLVLAPNQEKLAQMLTAPPAWALWEYQFLSGDFLAGTWLYLCVAALMTVPLSNPFPEAFRSPRLGAWAIFLAFSLSALAPSAANARFLPDLFQLISSRRSPLGEAFSGSALFVVLASMSTLVALAFLLRCIAHARFPRVAAATLVTFAWLNWPQVEASIQLRTLHALALLVSALAAVVAAPGMTVAFLIPPRPKLLIERIWAGAGALLSACAWWFGEPPLGFLPFAGTLALMLILLAVSRTSSPAP